MTQDNPPTGEIVPVEMGLVAPIDAESILAAFRKFEWLKKNVIRPSDTVKIGNVTRTKKSGWLRVALSCNVNTEKREERVERNDDEVVYHFTYRAISQTTGRFADAVGSASSSERQFTHIPHDVRALAQTRACSRAISNLVGGGEVSAEEMRSAPRTTTKAKTTSKKKATPKNTPEAKAALAEVILKKGQTWNKIFEKFGPEIQTRQEELGELWTFESAAVVVAREKGLVQGLPT